MPIREFNNDLQDLFGWVQDIGVIGVFGWRLPRDLQGRRDEDWVGRLNVDTKGLVKGWDSSLWAFHIQSHTVTARFGQAGGIGDRVNMAKWSEIFIRVWEGFCPGKCEEGPTGLQGQHLESIGTGAGVELCCIYKPDEHTDLRINSFLDEGCDGIIDVGVLYVWCNKQHGAFHPRLLGLSYGRI